jgi:GNAT superfamily N-acetyltransferase
METEKPTFAGKSPRSVAGSLMVRPLSESELPEADRIFRLAFGTFIGLPDPMKFADGCDFIRTRWHAKPEWTLAAEVEGRLAGSNVAVRWGSFAFFGPLTVHPDFWERGVAKRLLEATMDLFNEWGIRHAGLFTFPHSPKHAALYQKFGFWPRFLTALMTKPVKQSELATEAACYSQLSAEDRKRALAASRALTDEVFPGLDLTDEIGAVLNQNLGETVLLWDNSRLTAIAICHCGAGTEAGPDTCYVKFGAVRRGGAARDFGELLDACESLAKNRGNSRLLAGVNLGCHQAYREMIARGFRTEIQGIAMQLNNEPGFCLPEIFVLSDWR